MKNWKIKEKTGNFATELLEKYNPIILQLLKNRGLETPEEIEKYFNFDYEKDLSDPFLISGMEKAVERIKTARDNPPVGGEKIAIFGDYDADGVSASALLYETLTNLGFENIICYIPDRQLEGYGMNEKSINYLFENNVKLIITVDCGITNIKEIEEANKKGINVIITDHHHAPEILPEAYAIINPNIPNSGFVFREMAGVGVAFKLAQALYKKISPEKEDQLKWSLDLLALGTIADCVSLLGENRTLVKYGLIVLSKTKRAGFLEIFKVGRIDISEDKIPDTQKVAYQVAPRINAAGRMDHANVAYNLLIEKNPVLAREMALEVESNNQKRQKITAEIFREIQVLANNSFKDKKFIFAENPNWPVGILGLVAGKITEEFQKPSVILQRQESEFVGSLRSISEINIIEMLGKCSEFLFRFGGHSQAAGVTIKPENIEKFYEKMSQLIEEELAGKEIMPAIEVDCEIKLDDINWEFVSELKKMEPFGIGNEEPVFLAKNVVISDLKIVGNGSKHWKLSLMSDSGSPKIFDAIGFSLVEKFPDLKKDDKIEMVFNIQEDEWSGNKKIQLNLIDLKIIE
ncbi:MAG: single-stranded-DNA-specific exonuclease RecJ [Candidatus Moranbacteria bacterium RIFOXYA12_FULL_35_19]|nr:MAG: Single-stranded-DNA-specific exonuclease RecJ [Candidatus Moranbacteria bacterium GW2011_GWF2_35_39]OGI32897.1 MAG: single-stranded-DNA-specific exonuclease RecJ [Candidatus Moranbacteria bacterium RIFOXYC12_FULL_36_13]OGI33150.1 MAG: single-stranded-DNA-specific exonuclease RecJ [Candidatus Moranbacteria bacterium RIFOXYB12_FULL_35_8]OGI35983.1 MAG: single-stranded-DNA-specific exonuclease RecJ [Candidatus Moranbacteria bacterium RIFOXYA12_FULL_35_19]